MGWDTNNGYPKTLIDSDTGDLTIVHNNGTIIHEKNKNNK